MQDDAFVSAHIGSLEGPTDHDLETARQAFPGRQAVTPRRVGCAVVLAGDVAVRTDHDGDHAHQTLQQAHPGQRVTYEQDVWVVWPPVDVGMTQAQEGHS